MILTFYSLAVPVVTRFVADFLGFTHLIKSEKHPNRKYSEEDVYTHIQNCQSFLSYGSDETKTLKRRKAYKDSMEFLFKETRKSMSSANFVWFFLRDRYSGPGKGAARRL